MKKWIFSAGLVVVLLLPMIALAEQGIPNLKGTWVGQTRAIRFGQGDPQSHRGEEHVDKLITLDFTMIIDFQEGRLFHGTKASARNKEKITGVIRLDNEHLIMSDPDSFYHGKLLGPDKMELIWVESQHPVHGASHAIYTRKK